MAPRRMKAHGAASSVLWLRSIDRLFDLPWLIASNALLGGHPNRAPEHMIGFIARCWHWASSLDWWERGVVGALVGAFLFLLVPPVISYTSTSFVAYFWSLF